MTDRRNRRAFLKNASSLIVGGLATAGTQSRRATAQSKNDRFVIGAIGVGGQGTAIAERAHKFGDIVAVCDVDRERAEHARHKFGGKAHVHADFRELLDRPEIEAITIGTPDHWHTAVALAALRAGKDVYCEKPLTLTIAEGHLLIQAVQETGRIFQVGTQQRSDARFRQACELVRNGRLGKLHKVTVSLPRSTKTGGPFLTRPVPATLDWNLWQGQAAVHDYCPERCHHDFRWWYEYSGGIMTDWGAHHMDIAHWALGIEHGGPQIIESKMSDHERKRLNEAHHHNSFNTAGDFTVDLTYPGHVLVQVVLGDEGLLFEGDAGRLYVNRGKITGKPVEELAERPLPADAVRLYESHDHMGNFFDCIKHRKQPISDVVSQHRSVSACHLANIALRLGRKLTWDALKEEFIGDTEANAMRSRHQRAPFEVA
ncbi:MAG TPA: Gfo/Idh/MocA family oxidoreductase [Pirellulales bacterium]|nr:Gfo/Idh/MocA family oxidoreductase [Pirellulales bacterium]